LTNLCSLTGIACIPIQRWRHFHYLLNFMLGLAVSALFAAAVMVLIPEVSAFVTSYSLEEVPLEFGGQGFGYLRKLAFIPTGLYLFFIIEYLLLIAPRVFKVGAAIVLIHNGYIPTLDIRSASGQEEQAVAKASSCPCCTLANFTEVKPVAWMILLGDSVHNFMDGIAIAAGFTQSPSIGLTLSLCVLLEELPHELGDFAVLISSGFSIKAALCVNFISACSAYLGMIVGLLIGEASGDGSFYVFAAMAGVFLYISLSDMLPELRRSLEKAEKHNKSSLVVFLLEFAGLMVGCFCVVFVMLYSHSFMH
uniref:S39A8 protein n=1 Tax=Rodentolepis nana TaxID=102285 RepID=A0A0R3TT68_RODNA